jgi:Flp pilus assembly protein TadD
MSVPPASTYETWTTAGFLDKFAKVDETMADRAFCFVLGSGASRPSGIPTGGDLVHRWLQDLHRRYAPDAAPDGLAGWATAENLGIDGFEFDRADAFYSEVFSRRFGRDPEEGFAFLEAVMAGKEPSLGYSILAQILETTRHRVVITTNFDNLVADALSIYTRTYPFMCGHESLTSFVRPQMRRPLIAKIHRDLLLGPQNDPNEISKLAPGWGRTLRSLLQHYTPIVIGYGGNDGTLMGLMESLEPGQIVGGIYWCYRKADGLPSERIRAVVARHNGVFVPIVGFDECMVQLGDALKLRLLADEIERRASERVTLYRQQVEKIQSVLLLREATEDTVEVRQALSATIDRENDWWSWALRAREEEDPKQKEALYIEGIKEFPENPDLRGWYAGFLLDKERPREALEVTEAALGLSPEEPSLLSLAGVIHVELENDAEAERFFRKALELEATPTIMANLAVTLLLHRGIENEALELLTRAWQSGNAEVGSFYASLLLMRGKLAQAHTVANAAWGMTKEVAPTHLARLLLTLGIIARVLRDHDDEWLRRLKSLLSDKMPKTKWPFAKMVEAAEGLPDEDRALYNAIAAVLMREAAYETLEQFPRWKAL